MHLRPRGNGNLFARSFPANCIVNLNLSRYTATLRYACKSNSPRRHRPPFHLPNPRTSEPVLTEPMHYVNTSSPPAAKRVQTPVLSTLVHATSAPGEDLNILADGIVAF